MRRRTTARHTIRASSAARRAAQQHARRYRDPAQTAVDRRCRSAVRHADRPARPLPETASSVTAPAALVRPEIARRRSGVAGRYAEARRCRHRLARSRSLAGHLPIQGADRRLLRPRTNWARALPVDARPAGGVSANVSMPRWLRNSPIGIGHRPFALTGSSDISRFTSAALTDPGALCAQPVPQCIAASLGRQRDPRRDLKRLTLGDRRQVELRQIAKADGRFASPLGGCRQCRLGLWEGQTESSAGPGAAGDCAPAARPHSSRRRRGRGDGGADTHRWCRAAAPATDAPRSRHRVRLAAASPRGRTFRRREAPAKEKSRPGPAGDARAARCRRRVQEPIFGARHSATYEPTPPRSPLGAASSSGVRLQSGADDLHAPNARSVDGNA